MAYEDFTTYSEVDSNGYWSQTSTRNTFTNLPNSDSSYVYKDFGVDYFSGDFEHWFEFQRDDNAGHVVGIWGLTNVTGTFVGGMSGLYFLLYANGLFLGDHVSAHSDFDFTALSAGTTYYVKLWRTGTTLEAKVYTSSSDRESDTNEIRHLSVANVDNTTDYRYLQAGYVYGVGGTTSRSGYVENMNLTPGAPEAQAFEGADTVTISDAIVVSPTKEIYRGNDTLIFEDRIRFFKTYHEGTISSNETWKAEDNPHGITANVGIANGAIVTVEAGCEIYFEDGTRITVMSNGGGIHVDGTASNPVLFTSAKKLSLYGGNPAKGDWEYINDGNVFTAKSSYIHNAIVEYGGQGGVSALRHIPEIKNTTIKHCTGSGIEPYGDTDITIEENIIHDVNIGIYFAWGLNSTISTKYNLIYDTTAEAIKVGGSYDYNGNIEIINNTLIGSGSSEGIFFDNADGSGTAYVHNNIISNWNKGIYNDSSTISFDVDYNDYHNCTTTVDGVSAGTHSITSDPEFLNPSNDNYLIGTSSPCAFSGNPTYETYMGYDINFIPVLLDDQITLLRDDSLTTREEEEDSFSLSDNFELILTVRKDITQKIRTVKEEEIDIDQKINIATRSFSYLANVVGVVNDNLSDVDNDVRTYAQSTYNMENDVRVLADYQIPGDAGFQSLGKEYVKVYIDSIEQTDIDVDSITITKIVNGSHTASFELGRAYDSTKPAMEAVVQIYYHNWLLYKGYITEITPASSPEAIKINCNDKYWKNNRNKVYFFVGHKPRDNKEKYYYRISDALSTGIGWNPGIGYFIPETMNLFGTGTSDALTNLIQNCGNYAWYYDETETRKLWKAGSGSIIELEEQSIGTNLGLYQVLNHQFKDNVRNIVNKLRVQMGDRVIRRFNDTGGTKEYPSYIYEYYQLQALPDWDEDYEKLSKDSIDSDGYGWDYHPSDQNDLYKDVFKKYNLRFLEDETASWTDRYPPQVEILIPFSLWWEASVEEGILTEGFTIDYDNGKLIFNEPIYLFEKNEYGEIERVRAPEITLKLWKKQYYSNTEDDADDPESDISNPLMFFTDKVGSYSVTVIDQLQLTNLSIQYGGRYKDADGNTVVVPSWNDTYYAQDLAYWQLSNSAYKEVAGSINLTLDAVVAYGINLSNRINIDGVTDSALNIQSMTYNISDFQVNIQLKNGQVYNRTVSIPSHGE